ncbi:MAG: thiamine pyrophosphate-dependent dehydrogenase E1 component subunit alpha [Planctomycetes bacterium]|nr:thiamine pyrophosphate-dependent dehydrogenase E1 component subunit alpha [Planctomycetota bacterium]
MPAELLGVFGTGGVTKKLPVPELGRDELLQLHRNMVRTRKLDERGMKLQRQGRIGFYVPSFGEEAAQIGSAAALKKNDWVSPSYRQQGVALVRGVNATEMLDNCFGNSGDAAKGRQMPVHYTFRSHNFISIGSPIGTQIAHATGVAMAMRIRGDANVCLTYLGDGATSSNDFHTGLNFAGVFKSPCVFVCINNQYAISLNVAGQSGSTTIADKARAYGMPGVRVDGNDVLAVYATTLAAVEAARQGDGPTLLELFSFRMGPHSSSDDPSRYRPKVEEDEWRAKDPIQRFEKWLLENKHMTAADMAAVHEQAETEMAEAAKLSETKEAPSKDSLFEDVYAAMPASLKRQQAALHAEGDAHAQDRNAAFPL